MYGLQFRKNASSLTGCFFERKSVDFVVLLSQCELKKVLTFEGKCEQQEQAIIDKVVHWSASSMHTMASTTTCQKKKKGWFPQLSLDLGNDIALSALLGSSIQDIYLTRGFSSPCVQIPLEARSGFSA